MKRIMILAALAAILLPAGKAAAQDPEGALCYALPKTVINLEVEAVKETFHAGPYAKFAKKYLGIDVRMADAVTCTLGSVNLVPVVEADQSSRYLIVPGKGFPAFLSLSNQGLIATGDGLKSQEWNFAREGKGDFLGKGTSSNLTQESTTLWKNESGVSKGVKQLMIVEKSTEDKAREAANMIFTFRKMRVQIVTGDTDATYSGEAMKTVLDELSRLEEEYLSLFAGFSEFSNQKMSFSVIPEKSKSVGKYIAFRLSDSEGLLPSDDISGKPYILEVNAQPVTSAAGNAPASSKAVLAHYRIPATCTVRLLDGNMGVILQTRIPIYQLGLDSTFPINVK